VSDKIPILFDTDIGSDIDDAVALAYLLTQPRCDLLGVTTVTGEPIERARLADAVCQAFGRGDVPIHAGAGKPILVPQLQLQAPQKSVLPRYPHRQPEAFAPNVAVDFLRETIRSRPGEITLLSVGPLTNIGLLFALDPEIPRLLKRYVMMGGLYFSRPRNWHLAEWNAKGDPHATAVVFAANAPGTTCIGLDVTTQCVMPAEDCRKRFEQGPLKIVGDMAEVWFARARPQITFHDPLAAAVIFEPDLCTFEAGLVEVELQSDRLRGVTHFSPQASSRPHQVATTVRPDAFFGHYFATVAGRDN
jgi:purine nucleosidase